MELAIYGIGGIIRLTVFILLSIAPFYVLWKITSSIGKKSHLTWLPWVSTCFVLLSIFGWVYFSFSLFEKKCTESSGVQYFSKVEPLQPLGIIINQPYRSSSNTSFQYRELIENGTIQFVDLGHTKLCADTGKSHFGRFDVTSRCDEYKKVRAAYEVSVSPWVRENRWWMPSVYTEVTSLKEIKTNNVLAEGVDVIFGGGILGVYLKTLGGDQDFRHLSCGYASNTIDPWRPTLVSRKRFYDYLNTDFNLLLKSFGKQGSTIEAYM